MANENDQAKRVKTELNQTNQTTSSNINQSNTDNNNNQNNQTSTQKTQNSQSTQNTQSSIETQNSTTTSENDKLSPDTIEELIAMANEVELFNFAKQAALENPASESIKQLVQSLNTHHYLRKIFVRTFKLEKEAENDLLEAYSRFGAIKNVRICVNQTTGELRGFGFIEFEDVLSALKALSQRNVTVRGVSTSNSTFKSHQKPPVGFDRFQPQGAFAQPPFHGAMDINAPWAGNAPSFAQGQTPQRDVYNGRAQANIMGRELGMKANRSENGQN